MNYLRNHPRSRQAADCPSALDACGRDLPLLPMVGCHRSLPVPFTLINRFQPSFTPASQGLMINDHEPLVI